MGLLDKVNNFIFTYLETFRSFKKISLWVPFLVDALLQIVVLFVLFSFSSPVLAGIFVPLFKKMYGEAILHYPYFFLYLTTSPTLVPGVFNLANIIMGLILGIILDGTAMFMFCSHFTGKRISFLSGIGVALSRYGVLFALGMFRLAILFLVRMIPWLLKDIAVGSPRREFALEIGCMILVVICTGIFVYATPAVIWRRRNLFRAVADSWRTFIHNFFSTFLFISIPLMISFPVNFLKGRSGALIAKFNPEIVVWIIVLGIIVSVFANFILSGTIVKFYLGEEGAE